MVKVGNHEKKEVTEVNNAIYLGMLSTINAGQHTNHMGLNGLSNAVDWLEENYILIKKEIKE